MLEGLKPVLRAAAITAFAVGLLLLLIDPPSLSRAAELAATVAGAVGLVLLGAWATVALRGRESMSEREFERVVRRTEALARRPPEERELEAFELLVAEAIDRLPDELREVLETTPVVVSQRGRELRAYGHYSATRSPAGTTRTASSSTATRSSGTSATTPTCSPPRSSARCATRSPTTSAGASGGCASSGCEDRAGGGAPPRRRTGGRVGAVPGAV